MAFTNKFLLKLCVPITILATMSGCKKIVNAKDKTLYLNLSLIRKERSKDSNFQKTVISIENGIALCTVTHGGRDPRPDSSKKYSISHTSEEKIINYIIENNLNKNIRESRKCASPGVSIYIVSKITIKGITTKTDISGTKNFWGKKHGKKSNIRHIDYYYNLKSLLLFLKKEIDISIIEEP